MLLAVKMTLWLGKMPDDGLRDPRVIKHFNKFIQCTKRKELNAFIKRVILRQIVSSRRCVARARVEVEGRRDKLVLFANC